MKKRKNTILLPIIAFAFFNFHIGLAQGTTTKVRSFDKVIISPHIEVIFQQGNSESVLIESSTVSANKINIEVNSKTLRIYLDDAKELTKSEKTYHQGYKQKRPIYKGTVLKAIVTYKNLEELSLRGEEKFICKSTLTGDKFRLKIYGESQVYIKSLALRSLQTTIYGESYLELEDGTVDRQKITAYGETRVNTLGVESKSAKVTAYGEGSYRLNVSDNLKITAYGEATVAYQGNPEVNKGIIIGRSRIQKIQ
ncbi:head GIN domain-containing protein [Flagellimonas pacifica]|uniref:Putative auto-transporter adhesin, head GIN domain n=1 Tax=Flagellimonas pacifica TaxID=1247520 RepID=A0A285MCM0_9FLAO|nr:head GIN domain-containing protein [Allomuricauda parva]SNY94924.1 Putative auto-transporter adhesin, head GIN domain [Allomuricauda parva]